MRFLIGSLLLVLLPGVAAACVLSLHLFAGVPDVLLPVTIGTLAGILLDHFVLRRLPVIGTFEHEFTHAIVALMFFRRVTGFTVRRAGGTISHQGGFGGQFGTDCIGLAPYILPTLTMFSIFARPLVPLTWFPWYDGWIGMTFGYHVWSALQEIRESWTKRPFVSVGTGELTHTDIARRGYIYSAIFILTAGLAIHGVLIALMIRGVHGVGEWARETWNVTAVVSVHVGAQAKAFAVWAWGKTFG